MVGSLINKNHNKLPGHFNYWVTLNPQPIPTFLHPLHITHLKLRWATTATILILYVLARLFLSKPL